MNKMALILGNLKMRHNVAMMTSNSWSSCLFLPSASNRVIGTSQHTQLPF